MYMHVGEYSEYSYLRQRTKITLINTSVNVISTFYFTLYDYLHKLLIQFGLFVFAGYIEFCLYIPKLP